MAQFPSFLEELHLQILTLPKHGITTMTLRPLHLGQIYWKEDILMVLHSMWIRLQNQKLLLLLEALVMVITWTLLKCSLTGNGKQDHHYQKQFGPFLRCK